MAADLTSTSTVLMKIIGDGGGFALVQTPDTADDTDYFDMDTLLSTEGQDNINVTVVYATATDDADGTPVTTPMSWTQTTTTPDRVTIGSNVDNKQREVLVIFKSRSSTGGSA